MKTPLSSSSSPASSSSLSSSLRKTRLSPYLFALLSFIVFVSILYGEDLVCIFGQQRQVRPTSPRPGPRTGELTRPSISSSNIEKTDSETRGARPAGGTIYEAAVDGVLGSSEQRKSGASVGEPVIPFALGRGEEGCDVFSGRWVRDESARPSYEESECPYIQPQLTCQEHGRPDKDYRNWRWQPHSCSLPRFHFSSLCSINIFNFLLMRVGDFSFRLLLLVLCFFFFLFPVASTSEMVRWSTWGCLNLGNTVASSFSFWIVKRD